MRPEFVAVSSCHELIAAVEKGVKHVCVTAHLDFTQCEPWPDSKNLLANKFCLNRNSLSSIRGLCFKRPAAGVLGVSEHALQEWRPGQVVLVTDMPLTQQQSSIWLDNLFICHRCTARSPSEYLIKVKGSDAKLWMTKTTLCGDGLRKPEQGAIRVDTGQMYAEDTLVTGFHQQNLVMFISNGATVNFNKCTIWRNSVNSKAVRYGAIFKIRDWRQDLRQPTILSLKECSIYENGAYNIFLSYRRSWLPGFNAQIYSDIKLTVHNIDVGAANENSQPLSKVSMARKGILRSTGYFMDAKQESDTLMYALANMSTDQWTSLSTPSSSAPVPAGHVNSDTQVSEASLHATSAPSYQTQPFVAEVNVAELTAAAMRLEVTEQELEHIGFLAVPAALDDNLQAPAIEGTNVAARRVLQPSVDTDSPSERSKSVPAREYDEQDEKDPVQDTMDMSFTSEELLEPPGADATLEERMDFMHQQLDSFGTSQVAFDGLVFLGSGERDRIQGGQAIVQMAKCCRNRIEYAIKFFVSVEAFQVEGSMYSCGSGDQHKALAHFLPQVRGVHDNLDMEFCDRHGYALPPCIIMERGESLDLWVARRQPDRTQAFTMMTHLATRLRELHALGYVHRDLKPGNVMWLPRENRWTIIDFGCVARTGELARLGFSLVYAAPEEALDAWSLGVMAFELLTGKPALRMTEGKEQVMDRIEGLNNKRLPWEGSALSPTNRRKLGIFRASVLSLLCRDPASRVSLDDFCIACDRVLAGSTTVQLF